MGSITDDILSDRNVGINTIATFFDLKKAFDTVNHEILIYKLKHLGISGNLLFWLDNYLSQRKQQTKANGVISETEMVNCGVPQGSILGPLLFLVYINDVQKVCENVKICLFADDTVIYASNPNENVAVQNMQNGIDSFVAWCDKNRLTINIDKTKYMGFGKTKCFKNIILNVKGVNLKRVSSYKYLGVTLDPKLSYDIFMRSPLKTIAYRTYQLIKIYKPI